MQPLKDKVAVVAGATRGAGRGIACMLGEAGATVYCTGRSVRGKKIIPRRPKKYAAFELATRPETIDETAEMVTARGGVGIAAQVDHTIPEQVKELFAQVETEQGRLDVLVNDVWGGDELTEWKPFWEHSLGKGLLMLQRAIHSHIITSHYAAPLLMQTAHGLIVEITDGDGFYYRGTLYYDLVKVTAIRLAFDMAEELRKHRVSALALTPGFLRSEAMLEYLGVTEANWREGAKKEPSFIESETPFFVGRAVAALAADPQVSRKSGRVFSAWELAKEYGFTDVDGRRPDMQKWIEEHMPKFSASVKKCDDGFYAYCGNYEAMVEAMTNR